EFPMFLLSSGDCEGRERIIRENSIHISLDVVPMCILTPRTLNICGLILSFIGGVMLFIRFLAHLIRASGRPIWHSWFVRWCGRLGIALITIGFLLQLVAKFSQ